MDILKVPYDFRVDYDFGQATHNPVGEAPIDNPGTPHGFPNLTPKGSRKAGKVMHEFAKGTLNSGKGGPIVKDKAQAFAIAMSSGRKAQKGKY